MALPRRRREDWTPATAYEYPEHLRAQIDALPAAPGVYTFHGEAGGLPLYIGKSVNIRQRVLSHLRSAGEARMLRQARHITHERTAGEIGALLLEARRIKELQPLYNHRLRRTRQLCSWLLADGHVPQLVYARDMDFARAPDLFGLYGSRHAAIEGLRQIADQQRLCYGVLGLEKLSPGRPCFRASLRQCAGACHGAESEADHRQRLMDALMALQVAVWPHRDAVGLLERDGDASQIHVVRNWCYLGSAATVAEARRLDRVAAAFDADAYKILCRPILQGEVEIVAL